MSGVPEGGYWLDGDVPHLLCGLYLDEGHRLIDGHFECPPADYEERSA